MCGVVYVNPGRWGRTANGRSCITMRGRWNICRRQIATWLTIPMPYVTECRGGRVGEMKERGRCSQRRPIQKIRTKPIRNNRYSEPNKRWLRWLDAQKRERDSATKIQMLYSRAAIARPCSYIAMRGGWRMGTRQIREKGKYGQHKPNKNLKHCHCASLG